MWLALAVGLMAAFNAITKEQENKQQITYSEFINQVKKGEVTDANIEGSVMNGYIIKGERGSGKICLNGAAARRVQPDDIVIIMSYALMDFEEAKTFKPTVIFPDPVTNKVVK